jgi:hypothetical protein
MQTECTAEQLEFQDASEGALEETERVVAQLRARKPARLFRELRYETLDSWSRSRRVVGKAEQLPGKTTQSRVPPSVASVAPRADRSVTTNPNNATAQRHRCALLRRDRGRSACACALITISRRLELFGLGARQTSV